MWGDLLTFGKDNTFGNDNGPSKLPMNYWRLTAVIFFLVSGGPLGIEALVAAAGPLVALVSIFGVSWLWTVPETAVTTELSLVFPTDAGFTIWVWSAFGAFFGFLVWFLTFASGVLTMVVHPCFIINIVWSLVEPSLRDAGYYGWAKFLAVPLILALVSLNTWMGLRSGANVLCGACVFVLLPYLVFILWGLSNAEADRWIEGPTSGWADADWATVVTVLCWSLNFWQSSSGLSGEIEDLNVAFPSAMVSALWLCVTLLGLTLLAGTGASSAAQGAWKHQLFLATVAEEIAGKWLRYWLCLAGMVSSLGQLQAQMFTTCYMTAGLADKGLLPALFSQRNQHGTPIWPMAVACVATLVGACLVSSYADIARLIGGVNVTYCLAEILLLGGFIKLRYSHADFYRPYAVPLDLMGCILLVLPPLSLCGAIFYYASLKVWMVVLPLLALGMLLYPIKCYIKQREWLLYEDRDAFVYPWHLVKSPRSGSPYGAEEGDEDRAAAAPLFTRP